MGAKSYIGISGTARKLKKGYISIDGTARKIKKIYMGVNGVAQKIFGGSMVISYYGMLSDTLSYSYITRGTHIGDYAIFALSSIYYPDVFSKELVKSTAPAISGKEYNFLTTQTEKYAFIAGSTKYVNAYDKALTKTAATSFSNYISGSEGSAGHVGGNAVFIYLANSAMYNSSLTKTESTTTKLSVNRNQMGAASIKDDYLVLAGGYYSNNSVYVATVDILNASLTRAKSMTLNEAKGVSCGASIGDYALIIGGYGTSVSGYCSKKVEVFNSSLTKSLADNMSIGRYSEQNGQNAVTLGDYVIIAGGQASDAPTTAVDIYNASLTHTIGTSLTSARARGGAANVGNYALFAGGYKTNSDLQNTIEAYQLIEEE